MSETTESLKTRAEELARDIRRASRAFDQQEEIKTTRAAHKFLDELKGTSNYESVKLAYHLELQRDIPESEMPYTCPCHSKAENGVAIGILGDSII